MKGCSNYLLWILILSTCYFTMAKIDSARKLNGLVNKLAFMAQPVTSSKSFRQPNVESIRKKAVLIPQVGSLETDKISKLPGQPEGVNFNQYSGYITIDQENERSLFYYFVESPTDSSNKPLVLWVDEGIGCSSLGGAMMEVGPFRVDSDGKTLYINKYSWNSVANILFLDAPFGTGYSYSNTTTNYNINGAKQIVDETFIFLVNWLERFQNYKSNDFFIIGQGYASYIIPQLALNILGNNNQTNKYAINLKGIAIGNSYVDDISFTKGYYDYVWNHAIMSDETYLEIQRHCDFANVSTNCSIILLNSFNETGDLDYENIYAPLCINSTKDGLQSEVNSSIEIFDPCTENYVETYLNNQEVQIAFHANTTQWDYCIGLNFTDLPSTLLPTFKEVIATNLSILLYSGDLDSTNSITSTRYGIKGLELRVKDAWRPWLVKNEVGGYIEGYYGLNLAVVRGAGRDVPSDQPERAFVLFNSFLQGNVPK